MGTMGNIMRPRRIEGLDLDTEIRARSWHCLDNVLTMNMRTSEYYDVFKLADGFQLLALLL